MSDIPEEAVQAATAAYRDAWLREGVLHFPDLVRVALKAAAPAIAAHVRRQDEEERERTLVLDQDLAEEAEDNHGAPDLVERMAYAIPVRLVKSEAVGIGAARREYIARAVLPVVENEVERARADERRKIAAELRAEGERERIRLCGETGDSWSQESAIHNAITGWEMAAHFVEGGPKGTVTIINQLHERTENA